MAKMSFISMTIDPEAREAVFSFAEANGMSASELLRAGLRSMGVNIPGVRRPGRPHRPPTARPVPARVRTRTAVPSAS
jgi:hypothetical protein